MKSNYMYDLKRITTCTNVRLQMQDNQQKTCFFQEIFKRCVESKTAQKICQQILNGNGCMVSTVVCLTETVSKEAKKLTL